MTNTRTSLLSFPSLLRKIIRVHPTRRGFSALGKFHRNYGAEAETAQSNDQSAPSGSELESEPEPQDLSYLNPSPEDYSRFIFQDKCRSTIYAGSGGNGCVSFLREKYIEEGPANGGDGGSGGSVYIQAVENMTSLHKLARRGVLRAGRGKNGRGKSKGGRRGDDVMIHVPVGTVIREISRFDPVAEEENYRQMQKHDKRKEEAEKVEKAKKMGKMGESGELEELGEMGEMEEMEEMEEVDEMDEMGLPTLRHDRWVLYPGSKPSDFLTMVFPDNPPRRPQIASLEPKAPIHLDLSRPMDKPMVLAAGAVGGLGNHHFASRTMTRPTFAARGEGGIHLELEFELKLLADVGLVGKPNAGKSTLLRSLTNSRTRIGDWEFTTLSPSIGTFVIDDYKGRPLVETKDKSKRTNFTIADIPGLIEDAHLDRGLGLGFLRHIERAGILAFVVDLSAEDPIQALKNLWHELGEYQRVHDTESAMEDEETFPWGSSPSGLPELDAERHHKQQNPHAAPYEEGPASVSLLDSRGSLPSLPLPPIHSKPWFVVATKADLPETQERFKALRKYLSTVEKGQSGHPSGHQDAWREKLVAVPVSAMRGEGVNRIPRLVMELID